MGLKDCHEFIDLYSFDPSTATEFGLPINQFKGMILLFPLGNEEEEETTVIIDDYNSSVDSSNPKFIKQTIGNSCCMMALLHILLNNPKELLGESKPEIIDKLLEKNSSSGLEKLIEDSIELELIHKEMSLIGGTDVPNINDNVPFHFIALIPIKRSIWLMDGRRSGPIEYKNEKEEVSSLFEVACKIANEEFVMKSNDKNNFAAVILI